MSVTHIGTSIDGAGLDNNDNRQTITLDKPVGTQEGDFLLFFTVLNGEADFITPPSGVELINNTSQTTHSHMWGKLAGGSEPSSYTFEDEISTAYLQGVLIVWRDVADMGGGNFPLLHEVTSNSSSTLNLVTPTIDVTSAPARLIHFRQIRRTSSNPGNLSTSAQDVTEHVNRGAGTGSTSYRFAVWSEDDLRITTGNKTGITISASLSPTHNILRSVAILGPEVMDLNSSTVIDLAATVVNTVTKDSLSSSSFDIELDSDFSALKEAEATIEFSAELSNSAEAVKASLADAELDLELAIDSVVTDLFEGNNVGLDISISISAKAEKELSAIRVDVGDLASDAGFTTMGGSAEIVGDPTIVGIDKVAGLAEMDEIVADSAARILVGGMGV